MCTVNKYSGLVTFYFSMATPNSTHWGPLMTYSFDIQGKLTVCVFHARIHHTHCGFTMSYLPVLILPLKEPMAQGVRCHSYTLKIGNQHREVRCQK